MYYNRNREKNPNFKSTKSVSRPIFMAVAYIDRMTQYTFCQMHAFVDISSKSVDSLEKDFDGLELKDTPGSLQSSDSEFY